ncbi:hypothetical protein AB9E28_35095, partial [Rhizobium leguminosarum]
MRLAAAVIALLCLLPASAVAQWLPGQATEAVREGLEIGTSTSEIAITSDFHGADLTIFRARSCSPRSFWQTRTPYCAPMT